MPLPHYFTPIPSNFFRKLLAKYDRDAVDLLNGLQWHFSRSTRQYYGHSPWGYGPGHRLQP